MTSFDIFTSNHIIPVYHVCVPMVTFCCRASELSVEETAGLVYFDVLRNSGDMDWVSVELTTTSSTARATDGDILYLSLMQEVSINR